MTYSKNESSANLIKSQSKNLVLIILLCLVFFLNISPISSLDENINKSESTTEKLHQTIKTDDSDKEELEKRKKFKACELLIKVRLAQDIVFCLFIL